MIFNSHGVLWSVEELSQVKLAHCFGMSRLQSFEFSLVALSLGILFFKPSSLT